MRVKFLSEVFSDHTAISKESSKERTENPLSVLVITNRYSNFTQFLKQFINTNFHIIAVTDMSHIEEFRRISSKKITIIGSRSNNLSYLVNLGARYVQTSHFIWLGDDEILEKGSICLLQDLRPEAFSYKLLVETTFGNRTVKMWTNFVPRIFEKSVRFKRRIHEVPILKEESGILLNIKIRNNSYANWEEYWKKALSMAKREQKSFRRFFELSITPLYWFFVNGKCSDGALGIKLVWSSIVYACLSLKYGIRGHNFYDVEHIERLLDDKKQELSYEESTYITERLDDIKANWMKRAEEVSEELEQLSSPF